MFERRAAQSEAQMRKLIYGINVTLDGCCDHTKMNADEEVHDYFTRILREAAVLVYGRKTYELMVPFWPDVAKNHSKIKSMDDFADAFTDLSIVVFSRTLSSAEGNTRIVRSNLKDEILKLKQESGKDILLGGVDLPAQLIELGLVDEYRFVVQPILAGGGTRLLDGANLQDRLQLRLVESKIFTSGSVALHYVKQ
jgi:dihydrofolate reductase